MAISNPAESGPVRCSWAVKPLDIVYHDTEWGVPVHDDRVLFEFLTLEGAQAGLSWSTVLAKREHYREAFLGWDIGAIARFTPARIEKLMKNAGLVRHRGKLESTVTNARAFLAIQAEFGSFDEWLWRFVNGSPIVTPRARMRDVPTSTPESDALSKALIKRGFKFVGTTICYAYMQAVGLVDDHLADCTARISRGQTP
jgi:DNA-3-methyladenine glycosylase I